MFKDRWALLLLLVPPFTLFTSWEDIRVAVVVVVGESKKTCCRVLKDS
jgi:hypothetical protein